MCVLCVGVSGVRVFVLVLAALAHELVVSASDFLCHSDFKQSYVKLKVDK
jgi:hypothetical protein